MQQTLAPIAMKGVVLLALLALQYAGSGEAQGGPVTLFNTGVDASGTPLPDGTVGDPHYSIVAVPSGSTDILVLREVGGFPIPPWVLDDTISAWIGPNNGFRTESSPIGSYGYRTTFDLTGFIASTASISGQWATDNYGVDILINGASNGNSTPSDLQFHPFSITSGFVAGINTLDFLVYNDLKWTGLRVEMTGTATAVPEPSSFLMLGLGLAAFFRYGCRRRRTSAAPIAA